jgi:hypothetical protein
MDNDALYDMILADSRLGVGIIGPFDCGDAGSYLSGVVGPWLQPHAVPNILRSVIYSRAFKIKSDDKPRTPPPSNVRIRDVG